MSIREGQNMKKDHAYMYSLIEADDMTVHSGMTVNTSLQAVRDDIEHNFIDPCYVRVTRIWELEPQLDADGNLIGYTQLADL